ncbi:hypothetical protein CRG98_044948 [Punica granatum]|uniref:Uncharacterized protein n=1 Tax=Punica granatum TaxID=22663 RepID=A0A2I0HSJ2_PUNGR|nr:hypothetical protein CRG98_044948 [Punica granatum]
MNSVPSFGRVSSCGKPVGQNRVLTADTEQERRLKRMEETIRALQANDARPDAHYGDYSLFPGMRLPPKFKIPEFKTYEGTTDPRHHLRHYRGKMLQYWDEAQQIQLFHSTLRGVCYSHLLAHTSSFSDLIEAGKKLDVDIKLGRMEGPASKEEKSSKKVPATSSSSGGRRGKEVSVNAVNTAHQASQQYLMNFTSAPPVAPSYAPHAPQYWPQPLPIQSTILHYRLHPHLLCQAAVGFTGIDAPLTPFVIDVPAREPYSDDKVPWTYEGSVGSLEQQLGVMGITRSGLVYENSAVTDKGKALAAKTEVIPGVPRAPSKRVTEEEAEAFMRITKASEHKVAEQMAKSPAHISVGNWCMP